LHYEPVQRGVTAFHALSFPRQRFSVQVFVSWESAQGAAQVVLQVATLRKAGIEIESAIFGHTVLQPAGVLNQIESNWSSM